MLKKFYTVKFPSKEKVKLIDELLYLDYNLYRGMVESKVVEPITAFRYQGNFFGLLKHLDIDPSLFVLSLKVNGITNSNSYDGVQTTIKIPRAGAIPKN